MADCKKCIYRSPESSSNGEVTYNYILYTGHRRLCPAGKDCTKFEKGKRLRGQVNPYGVQRVKKVEV